MIDESISMPRRLRDVYKSLCSIHHDLEYGEVLTIDELETALKQVKRCQTRLDSITRIIACDIKIHKDYPDKK